jgi:DNA repair exonuclease SbcCD ATPase subunit
MGMTNAEKQAAYRARRESELTALRAEVVRLREHEAELRNRKPTADALKPGERELAEANAEAATLPGADQAKLKRSVERFKNLCQRHYEAAIAKVEASVSAEVEKRTAHLAQLYRAKEEEAEQTKDQYKRASKALDEWMTEKEFRIVRSCLSPDKPDRTVESLIKAFEIFNRLQERTSTDARTLRKNDWPSFADAPIRKRRAGR